MHLKTCVLSIVALAAAGCATRPADDPQSRFMARIAGLCGQAFAGRVVSNDPADADFAGKPLVMHVASCRQGEVRIPFHVGDDRSRTWAITRTATGLRLKHDHRHEDGKPDAVTMYGGDTAGPGTAVRQEFSVDAESIVLFKANELPKSVTNVWAVEASGRVFAYELRRPAPHARFFRVEFDLTRPVAPPPLPWGRQLSQPTRFPFGLALPDLASAITMRPTSSSSSSDAHDDH